VPVVSLLELTLATETAAGLDVVHDVLRATRAFDGCLSVEVTVDTADPAHVVVVERWQSIEADDAYRAWRATPEGRSALASILAAPPVLTRCTVAEGV
jgi:quinol monooxygenase YgiN